MRSASLLLAIPLLAACASSPSSVSREPQPSNPPPTVAASHVPALASAPTIDVPLSFDRGLWHIEGTLTMPAHTEGALVPVVVIVHGSGPMSRDGVMHGQIGLGFGFEMPVYRLLANALAARGYAVYRYDKRTCGQFNGCSETGFTSIPYNMVETEFATKEYVGDAVAAMDAVQQMPAIDPRRTFFIGHSEGGGLVPLLLSERPAIRAGVMLAPPFHTMTTVLEQQSERLRWAYSTIGDPTRAAKEGAVLLDAARALAAVENGTSFGELILGQPPGLWASWIEIAKKAPLVARELDQPLLVLGGGYDYNVATSEINAWAHWLATAKHARHRVKIFHCVTHALNCIIEPDPSRVQDSDIGRDIDAGLLDEIVTFLDANARPS
jgi:alpha-beta hydrolase superfamily lysophospholipase